MNKRSAIVIPGRQPKDVRDAALAEHSIELRQLGGSMSAPITEEPSRHEGEKRPQPELGMDANSPDREGGIAASRLDAVLLISATAAMAIAIGLLVYVIASQLSLYHSSIATELRAPSVDHLAVLAYARSADYAASKYCALLLGFALIFLGSAYVLRVSTVTYGISAEARGVSWSLATSSPGLVMVTLGVGLVALAVLTQSDVTLTYASQAPSPHLPIVEDKSD